MSLFMIHKQSVTSRLETSRYRDFSQFFESSGLGLENFGLEKSLVIGLDEIFWSRHSVLIYALNEPKWCLLLCYALLMLMVFYFLSNAILNQYHCFMAVEDKECAAETVCL